MAAASGKGDVSGSATQPGSGLDLDELLKSLNLREEDIEGLAVAKEEVETLKEGTKWMAVMRLLSSKMFSATLLKKTMMFAWAPAKEVTFRELENDKFIVQANYLGDWQKITEQGLWIFHDHGLLLRSMMGAARHRQLS